MGRGQGKATDLGNNGPNYAPWTWIATAWFDSPVNRNPSQWSSTRHNLRVVAIEGGKCVISDEHGALLRGSKRVRQFGSFSTAQLAADMEKGF